MTDFGGSRYWEMGFPPGVLNMSQQFTAMGHGRFLEKFLKKGLAVCAISCHVAVWESVPARASGETRTISLRHIHTGESLTVTYMRDGRYVPSAMKQINYLLRDWRKNEIITIDPRTIDLVWELHEDLGSHAPINIVCGYRSAKTNAMLRRLSGGVAKESQHIKGKAIDFYLTDVPTVKIRNVALVHQVGGVGYYRTSGGPTGFLHVDSGSVRHWGPYISPSQMAQIFNDGKKYMGRHAKGGGSFSGETEMASAEDTSNKQAPHGLLSKLFGLDKQSTTAAAPLTQQAASTRPPLDKGGTYSAAGQSDLADLSADAAAAPKAKLPAPVATVDNAEGSSIDDASQPLVKKGRDVPKPRLKPVDIMLMAAANMKTEPRMIRINAAAAIPSRQTGKDVPSPVAGGLGTLMEAAAAENPLIRPSNGKGNLATELKNGLAKSIPVIKPMIASAAGSEINWWPQMFLQGDAAIRRDGRPPLIGAPDSDILPKAANLGGDTSVAFAEGIDQQQSATGKGDLMVNESGKGDLDPPGPSFLAQQ